MENKRIEILCWGRNTSFQKILNALEHNGSPKPIFETDPERLSFMTTLFIHPAFLHQNGNLEFENDAVNGVVNDIEKLSKSEQAVLNKIKENPYATITEIASAIGKSRSTIDHAIRNLKKKQVISRNGADKFGSWTILK